MSKDIHHTFYDAELYEFYIPRENNNTHILLDKLYEMGIGFGNYISVRNDVFVLDTRQIPDLYVIRGAVDHFNTYGVRVQQDSVHSLCYRGAGLSNFPDHPPSNAFLAVSKSLTMIEPRLVVYPEYFPREFVLAQRGEVLMPESTVEEKEIRAEDTVTNGVDHTPDTLSHL